MQKFIYIFIFMISYRIIHNFSSYKSCCKIEKQYSNWLNKQNFSLCESKSKFKNLIERAGIKDVAIPTISNLGYGQIASHNASVLFNFPYNQVDHVKATYSLLYNAKGVYKNRCIESLNPIFWIDTLIHLPRAILGYLGLSEETLSVKFFQLLYWLLVPVFLFFRKYIYAVVIELLDKAN